MLGLQQSLNLTSTDLDDIALYIWYRAANQNCPAPAPAVSANPTSLSFGSVNVGASSATQQVTISNTGAANATGMTYPAAPANFSRTTTCGATLNAGASCTVTFTFSPTAGGSFAPTWTVTGSGGVSVPIGLSGTGVAATPSLQASPTAAAFGSVTVGQTSATQAITVTNSGGGAATGVALNNPNTTEFLVTGNTCGSSLAAGASCGFNLAYKPAAAGVDNATLTINYAGGSATVNMSGNGTAPAVASLAANPPSLSFGNVTVGTSSTPRNVTVTNSGGATATGLSMSNSNAARFAVSGNNCGTSLAAGASCSLNVTFTPAAAGADTGNLTFTHAGGQVVVAMTGSGTAAPTASLTATPPTLSFGNVTVGQTGAAQTVTVGNTGGAQATGVAVASGSSEFAVSGNTCGATLNAGATCTFNVAYAPNGAGADSAAVTVSFAGGSTQVAVSGTGTAAASPNLSAAPPLASFGNVTVGQASNGIAITVSNTGGASATGITLTNSNASEFAVSANTCGATLNAGATCSLTVTYTPSAAGSDSATLTFNYGAGALSVSLTGSGVSTQPPPGQGQLSLPSAVSLPDTAVGATSAGTLVTLSNIGSTAVTVGAVTSSSGEFLVAGSNCGTVNAGSACSFTVSFAPSAAGARTATITVADNGAGGPHTILVTGNGVSAGGGDGTTVAVEFYHQGFDHYFITWVPAEIANLDSGRTTGWARTGQSFKVYTAPQGGTAAVCRIYIPPGKGDGHFFGRDANECDGTMLKNPTFILESSTFFYLFPPSAGNCGGGTVPVYRVFSNRADANHRYTTDRATRDVMVAKAWIAEGDGADVVVMCAPQ